MKYKEELLMKSKKFLAALAAVVAVSAVATTGLVAQADEEFGADAAPEVAAPAEVVSQVEETPVTPSAPVVASKSEEVEVSVPEPVVVANDTEQDTVAAVDDNSGVEAQDATDAVSTDVAPTATTAVAGTTAAAAGTTTTVATGVTTTLATNATTATNGTTATAITNPSLDDVETTAATTTATVATKTETKTETKTAIDYNKIYSDYVNNDIIKNIEGGLASLEPQMKNPEKDYVRKELLGLVSAQVYDFGGDGVKELLTVTREQCHDYSKETESACFLMNLYQYDEGEKAVKKIGQEDIGIYSLSTEGPFAESEKDSKFQLAIVGDSIYFVEDQNDTTRRAVYEVDTKNTEDAINWAYELYSNGAAIYDTETEAPLYINKDKYKEMTGSDYTYDEPVFSTADELNAYIRDQFNSMKVPVNDVKLVDSKKDGVSVDLKFDDKKVTMLTQYEAAPKFKTVDFTGLRGTSKPAGTSEKKNDSKKDDGTTSSPKTGDSRVPVAAGAAAVAAAAAAVAFVTKKRG
jgi:hypothetical protein